MNDQPGGRCSAAAELCSWTGSESDQSSHESSCAYVALRPVLRALINRIGDLEGELRAANSSSPLIGKPLEITFPPRREVSHPAPPPPPPAASSQSSAPLPPPPPPSHPTRPPPPPHNHPPSHKPRENPPVAAAPSINAADLSRAFAALKPVEEEEVIDPSAVGDVPVPLGSSLTSELASKVTSLKHEHENVAAEDPALQAARMREIRERQEAQEAEFKRRHEEAERQKQATLNAMRAADDERRARLLALAPPPSSSSSSSHNPSSHFSGTAPAANFAVPSQLTNPSGPKCGGCNQPIPTIGSFLRAAGKKWHVDCLRCSSCRSTLENGFRQVGQRLLCEKCSRR